MRNITVFITIILLLTINDIVLGQAVKKWVLLEQFTNTHCPQCGYRNPELYEIALKPYDTEIIHIAYHNNRPLKADPFHQANPVPTITRTEYYDVSASPSLIVNGQRLKADKPLITTEQLEKQLNQSSPLHLTIKEKIQANKEREILISAKTATELPNAPYKLFVAVVEKDVFFCTYFENVFDNLFRSFLSSDKGDEITLSSNEKSYTYQYTPKTDWKEEQLFVVAFVQNTESKEIMNAIATEALNTNQTIRYNNDDFSLLSTLADDVCGENDGFIELDICVDTFPREDPTDLSFTWSNGAKTQDIYNLAAGNYSVKITNNVLETTTEQFYEIQGNEKIQVTVNTQADTGSANGSIQVQASGGKGKLAIEWNTNENSFNLNGLQAGVYSFIVTDENGCAHQQTVEVKSERVINLGEAIVETQPVSCKGKSDGSVTISSSGDVPVQKVVWLMEDKNGNNLVGLSAGNYTFFTLDEADNQMHEGSFIIEEPASLEMLSKQSNGFEEPYINIEQVSGGTPPYQYKWSNGITDTQIENIEPGEYGLELSDSKACILKKDFIIKQNTITVQSISCNGAKDGAIEVIINDGIQYNFHWTNGETQPSISNLPADRYGLSVSHENFRQFLSFDIEEPRQLELLLQYDSLSAAIQPQIRGGTPPYRFLWNNGMETPTLANTEAGIFSLQVVDANNCNRTAEIEIADITSTSNPAITALSNLSFKQLSLYPNPVEKVAFVNLPSSYQKQHVELTNVQLLDVHGVEHNASIKITKNQLEIDFSTFPPGVYLLQILDDEHSLRYVAKALVCR